MPLETSEGKIFEDYPIHRGVGDELIRSIEHRDISVGDHGPQYTYNDKSYRRMNAVALKAYLVQRANGPLTSFEESVIGEWDKYEYPVLVPIYQAGDVGLVGYMLTRGESGDTIHTLYTRSGNKLREYHTEVPLVNMGLGPFEYILLITGALGLGRYAIGKYFAKRAVTEGTEGAIAKEFIAEEDGVLAVIQDGKIIAQSRDVLLPHDEFVFRKLKWRKGDIPSGVEVVTIGKHRGEIGAVLSRTFHPQGGLASPAAQEAAKKAYR